MNRGVGGQDGRRCRKACHFSSELGDAPLEFGDVVSDHPKVCFRQLCDLCWFIRPFLFFSFGTLALSVNEPAFDISHALFEGTYMGHSPAFEFFKAFGYDQQCSRDIQSP